MAIIAEESPLLGITREEISEPAAEPGDASQAATPCRAWVQEAGLLACDCPSAAAGTWVMYDIQGRQVAQGTAPAGYSVHPLDVRGPVFLRWAQGAATTLWMP